MRLAVVGVFVAALAGTAFLVDIPDLLILAGRHRITTATIATEGKVSSVHFAFEGANYSRQLPLHAAGEAPIYFDPQKPLRLSVDPPGTALRNALPAWAALSLALGAPLAWAAYRLLRPRQDCCA